MSGPSPSFSVVIPTHDRRALVSDALTALANVKYPGSVEVIVVADGCSDGTASAIRALECPFRVRVIEQPHRGAARARNTGAAAASGEIMLFLDDDMMCEPDILREHARMYEDGADAVLGHIPVHRQSPPGFLADDAAAFAESMLSQSELSGLDVFTGQLSVRRSVFERVGGFDEGFTTDSVLGMEDADFGLRLMEGHRLAHNPAAISHQRYVVTPRENMRRLSRWAAADVRFARKHPHLAQELFRSRGAGRPATRFLYRPLSRIPLFANAAAAVGVRLSEWALTTRFRSSRTIARLFSASRAIAYWQHLRASGGVPRSKGLLILCYHAIRDLSGDPVLTPYGLPDKELAKQLDDLSARGFNFVSPGEFAALMGGRGRLPRKAVLLTFDDCYEELGEVAEKVLRPRGIRAIAFAVTGMESGTNEWDQRIGARPLRLLDAAGLRTLIQAGVEVGSHSRSHRPLPQLNDSELHEETSGAIDDFARKGLPRPRFFAYPHGDHDDRTRAAVRGAGFEAAFALGLRKAGKTSDPYDVPRVVVLARDVGWRFRAKTTWPQLGNLLESRILNRVVNAIAAPMKVELQP